MFSTVSSRIALCQIIRPTGSSSGAWQGIEIAQPSSMLTTLVFRSNSAFTRKNSSSRSAPGATCAIVAPPIAQVAPGAERDEEFFRVNALLLRNTSVVNMLDGCAISIPCHAPDELPVGLMIWQSAMRDDTVLNIARQAEAALANARDS